MNMVQYSEAAGTEEWKTKLRGKTRLEAFVLSLTLKKIHFKAVNRAKKLAFRSRQAWIDHINFENIWSEKEWFIEGRHQMNPIRKFF